MLYTKEPYPDRRCVAAPNGFNRFLICHPLTLNKRDLDDLEKPKLPLEEMWATDSSEDGNTRDKPCLQQHTNLTPLPCTTVYLGT